MKSTSGWDVDEGKREKAALEEDCRNVSPKGGNYLFARQ